MTVKNATELCALVENTLGWTPIVSDKMPRWRAIAIMAGRVNKKIETNPKLYTWRNLEIAVAYLWAKRQQVRSPMGIFYVVEDAVAQSYETPQQPLGDQVEQAIRTEYEIDDAQTIRWVTRLSRAFGDARADVLVEWRAARR